MDHQDHVGLLRDGITSLGGIWAEFGSGGGAFTLALAELIGPEGEIFSIDYDRAALINQSRKFTRERYPHLPEIHYLYKDYRQPISLPPLNGLLMANSLHFQEDKVPVLRLIYNYLLPGGSLILVEYNSDQDNPWVPYPISGQPYQQSCAQ